MKLISFLLNNTACYGAVIGNNTGSGDAGQGVGEGIASTLAAAGAEVLVNDFFAERAEAVTEAIRAAGGAASGSCIVAEMQTAGRGRRGRGRGLPRPARPRVHAGRDLRLRDHRRRGLRIRQGECD